MNKTSKSKWVVILLITGIIIAFFSLLLFYFQFGKNGVSDQILNWSLFGTYFGGVTGTILSLISIVLIYATYKRQVDFSETQSTLLTEQQFESSFFSLLNNQKRISTSLEESFKIKRSQDNNLPTDNFFSVIADELRTLFSDDFTFTEEDEVVFKTFNPEKKENLKIINTLYQPLYIDNASWINRRKLTPLPV